MVKKGSFEDGQRKVGEILVKIASFNQRLFFEPSPFFLYLYLFPFTSRTRPNRRRSMANSIAGTTHMEDVWLEADWIKRGSNSQYLIITYTEFRVLSTMPYASSLLTVNFFPVLNSFVVISVCLCHFNLISYARFMASLFCFECFKGWSQIDVEFYQVFIGLNGHL